MLEQIYASRITTLPLVLGRASSRRARLVCWNFADGQAQARPKHTDEASVAVDVSLRRYEDALAVRFAGGERRQTQARTVFSAVAHKSLTRDVHLLPIERA